MGDLVGIIFLIGLAVLVVVLTVQILWDRKRRKTRLTEDSAASLDDSLILPIDINNEDFSMQQSECAHHDAGHSDFSGDHSCGDFGGGHHH